MLVLGEATIVLIQNDWFALKHRLWDSHVASFLVNQCCTLASSIEIVSFTQTLSISYISIITGIYEYIGPADLSVQVG